MTIIEIDAHSEKWHTLERKDYATEVWQEGYIEVPQALEADVWACRGYCDLTIQGGVLTGITAYTPPKPEPEPATEYVTYGELAAAIREGVNAVE